MLVSCLEGFEDSSWDLARCWLPSPIPQLSMQFQYQISSRSKESAYGILWPEFRVTCLPRDMVTLYWIKFGIFVRILMQASSREGTKLFQEHIANIYSLWNDFSWVKKIGRHARRRHKCHAVTPHQIHFVLLSAPIGTPSLHECILAPNQSHAPRVSTIVC